MRISPFASGFVFILALLPATVPAAIFVVDSEPDAIDTNPGDGNCATAGGLCSLRAAVMEANVLPGDDSIQVPAGIFTLDIPATVAVTDAEGDLDVTENLTITGAGAASTTVDASALTGMFLVSPNVSLALDGLTLDAGRPDPLTSGDPRLIESGSGSSLTLNNLEIAPLAGATLTSTMMVRHAGVYLEVNSLSFSSDTVYYFFHMDPAGGPSVTVDLDGVTLDAPPGSAKVPALIDLNTSIDGTVTVTNTLFNWNATGSAQVGVDVNALGTASVTVAVEDSEWRGYPSSAAAWLTADPTAQIAVGIARCTFTSQSYPMYTDGDLTVDDSLLATTGGWFQLFSTSAIFRNSTILVDNSPGFLEIPNGEFRNSTILARPTNTLVLRNSLVAGPCNSGATLVSEGHNLVQDATNCAITGDLTGNLLNLDPMLDILADNGGPTESFMPLAGSPLLDAGDTATPGTGGFACETTDQRGIVRPQDGTGDSSAVCDIGAVESAGVPAPVLDYGDAPVPYPTLIADDGARHRTGSLFLGSGVTAEAEGKPSPNADADSDDGVSFLGPFEPGLSTSVEVTVSENANLELWWDFDQNGVWNDPGEQQPVQQSVSAGTTTLVINVPSNAPSGDTYMRVRASSGPMEPTGKVGDGEVEDYKITVIEPTVVRAFAGPSRDVAVGGTVPIGGSPTADGGQPPYGYDWDLTDATAGFTVDSQTIANPTLTPTSEGYIDTCIDVTDQVPDMANDCATIDSFCADAVNSDPSSGSESGQADYWASEQVVSEQYTVNTGGVVNYFAGEGVSLGDGFSVKPGARFAVNIDSNINTGCPVP